MIIGTFLAVDAKSKEEFSHNFISVSRSDTMGHHKLFKARCKFRSYEWRLIIKNAPTAEDEIILMDFNWKLS